MRHTRWRGCCCTPIPTRSAFPNQGLQILYEILNERDDAVAERSYTPWPDLAAQLRKANLPLFSVDTHRAAADFDLLAFNLAAELVFTNVLECIDLAGIAVRADQRAQDDPLVVAGGHSAFNPEPLADFVDAFVMGDGEEVVGEITEVIRSWKTAGKSSRHAVLRDLASVEGVYVPQLYDVRYDGADLVSVTPAYDDVPAVVQKRTISDLGEWPYPKNQLVPVTEVVHDRLNVEVFRGCTRGCRFCQAGMITRPVRERPEAQVTAMIKTGLERTGYDQVALTSLSTADFSGIDRVVADTINSCDGVTISLPSLRVDAFTVGLAADISRARRTGLTFAPEAGTWRLRQVINKLITADDLYGAVDSAYSQGWHRMKLYFLTGLPTEMDDDAAAVAELAAQCVRVGKRHTRKASVTLSLGGFVPKAHTPFQWFGQNGAEELRRKVNIVRAATKGNGGVHLKWHAPEATLIEGLCSRGDRRIGAVIEEVWRRGGVFQEWTEHFDLSLWQDAMAHHGLSMDWYVTRHRTEHEVLPWDHISAGLHRDFLWDDWRAALDGHGLPDCRWTPCYDCGACTEYGVEHVVAQATAPAGGSQGTDQDLALATAGGDGVPVRLVAKRQAGVGA